MNQPAEVLTPAPSTSARSVYIESVAVVSALFFFGVGLPCWYAFDLAWGVGLGAMCAFWGGPGFGVMAAGARLELRSEDHGRTITSEQPAMGPLAKTPNEQIERRLPAQNLPEMALG